MVPPKATKNWSEKKEEDTQRVVRGSRVKGAPSVRQESSAGPGALEESGDAGIAKAPLDFLASVTSERAASKCWWQRRMVP